MAPRPGATIASEWTKLRSVRSSWLTLVVAVVLAIGLTALFATAVAAGHDTLSPPEKLAFDPVGSGLFALGLVLIPFIVLAVNATASEFASRMIAVSLAITARRGRFLAAKVLVVGAVAAVGGLFCAVAAFLVSQGIFAGAGVPYAGFGDPGVLRTVFGWALQIVLFSLLGVLVAVLLRSAAGAIATLLGLVYLPAILGPMLPDWVHTHVLRFLPSATADAFTGNGTQNLPLWAAGLVMAAWIGLLWTVTRHVLVTRDAR
ncbi:ABC transporter permease [Amycolatopsis sp. YIM 10]|uniref:ABC transporter permease n=1 Tax=Amycolatopsis sp. YIM 10 TaxID=2653857 RepID=UPI00128FD529|nr:ABC transporter permease [Amycolatopsis sp. YIM 10]QFU92372.1 ABC-2 family transporter protein [Amycolatopsis sp. YIM 10]